MLDLRLYQLDSADVKTEKKHVLVLKGKDKTILFAASTEQEKDEWATQIKAQLGREPSTPPENGHAKGKGAKYAIQTNVASSVLGRKLIKEIVDADTWKILDAVCSYLTKTRGEETASKFKKDIVKIGTKIAILHNNKLLSKEALEKMNKTIRPIAQTVVDYYQMPSIFDAPTLATFINALRRYVFTYLTTMGSLLLL